jgi:hypothetical protein
MITDNRMSAVILTAVKIAGKRGFGNYTIDERPKGVAMKTMTQILGEEAAGIKKDLTELLAHHSRLQPPKKFPSTVVYISPDGDRFWSELPVEGKQLQSKVMNQYRHFRTLISTLIRDLPGDALETFSESDGFIERHIDQQRPTWCETRSAAAEKTCTAIDDMLALVEQLHSASGECLVVPDTNALIRSPRLQEWNLGWTEKFTIILLPTVLAELDKLKIEHRNPEVREKAESLVRTFREYFRRGDIHAGVPIINGKINLRAIAVEPNIAASLPWLDAGNNDDRIIASMIEVIRANVRSLVVLITADANMLNKAKYAGLPVEDPPILQNDPT